MSEKALLVEDCQAIDINDLVRQVSVEIKRKLLESQLETMGVSVKLTTSRTRFNGQRLWFECPSCETQVGTLYEHPTWDLVACRRCLGLDYEKHRYSKMAEVQL